MSATYAARTSRQTVILAVTAGLHVAVFGLAASGLGPQLIGPKPSPPTITVIPPKPPIDPVVEPVPEGPPGFDPTPEAEPILPIPVFEDVLPLRSEADNQVPSGAGSGPVAPVKVTGPILRTRDNRLAAMINSCYPTTARRLEEEGRTVARLLIDASGRATSWTIQKSSGFSRLDTAMGCVIRRLEFVPGRRDGRAVEAIALLPIVFELD